MPVETPTAPRIADVEVRHFHLFCGLGGGAKGFNRGEARAGSLRAKFRCIGGIDVDPGAIADFGRLAGVPGTVLDLFSREQYVAFHGREPDADWREASAFDIQRAAGGERPHIVFLSAPCKGFSGLLSETASRSAKYQSLNGLTLRGVWLMLEAWKDDPPELIVFENVPRIARRGRALLDQIVALLRAYGYAVAETTHDCGEIGNLAQSRKRFLLVARHTVKVPPFLYEPEKHSLRGVGEILDKLPMPGPETVLPMHRMPALQWKTWVRLAFVEAGSDWRSLNRLDVRDGYLADFGIVPGECHNGALGVRRWKDSAGTVTSNGRPASGAFSVADPRASGRERSTQLGVHAWDESTGVVAGESFPTNGAFCVADPRVPVSPGADFHGMRVKTWKQSADAVTTQRSPGSSALSVADPRIDGHEKSVQFGVRRWKEPAGVVTGKMFVGGGPNSVADPRLGRVAFNHVYRIVPWEGSSPAVAGPGGPANGAGVADPRYTNWHPGASSSKLRVTEWGGKGGTVTGSQQVASGALSVADPRPEALRRADRDAYLTQGHYGVNRWDEHSGAVPAFAKNNNGSWSVADPRGTDGETVSWNPEGEPDVLPALGERLVCMIRALDGTWHRPFTTLELAALQSLVDPEDFLELEGLSDSAWRERIGNAVPPAAAQAIASVMGRTLLMAWTGQTFVLSSEPIWVQPIALALTVPDQPAADLF